MYNNEYKQYIFKQSNEKVRSFYFNDKLGICYSLLNNKNTWTEPVSLIKNCYHSFYADMDLNDCFHIIFQDDKGNIYYQHINQDAVKTIPILNSKFPSRYEKNLYLIPDKNIVHTFFTIHHNQDLILAHQILSGNTPSKPKVVDYVNNTSLPYCVCCDKSSNIYAIYQSSDGKNFQLGFKKYAGGQNFWSEFIPITKYKGDCELPRCINDFENILHLCYQRRSSRQYELVYIQKLPDKNLWTEEVVLHTSSYPFTECSILYSSGSLYVYWLRDDAIYFTSSKDKGKQWSKPSKYNFPMGKQLFCSSYKTNWDRESGNIIIRDIPASFINGYKMPFYQEPSKVSNDVSPEGLKNMIVESLSLLKNSVNELKDSNSGILQSISHITNSQQNLDREITKYSYRLNIIEKELNQIKSVTDELKVYRNTINELMLRGKNKQSEPLKHLNKQKLILQKPDKKVYYKSGIK